MSLSFPHQQQTGLCNPDLSLYFFNQAVFYFYLRFLLFPEVKFQFFQLFLKHLKKDLRYFLASGIYQRRIAYHRRGYLCAAPAV